MYDVYDSDAYCAPVNLARHLPSGLGCTLTKRPRANTVRPYNVLLAGCVYKKAPRKATTLRSVLCYTDNAAIGGKALHNNGRRLATLPERG